MIVLGTKVISEPLKAVPEQKVVKWLDKQSAETLSITAVSRAELRFGLLRLPEGKRKRALAARVEQALDLFSGRTLDFDSAAADKLAEMAADCEQNGKRAAARDSYIAATAAAHGFAVTTRNGNHFQHLGVRVVDPWS